MFRLVNLFACLIISTLAYAQDNTPNYTYTGSDSCKGCHADAYKTWQDSDHFHAMERPSQKSVLGNFDNQIIKHDGTQTRFYKKGEDYMIQTLGPDGKMTDYKVAYTFGWDPLQQYLVDIGGGRYQVTTLAWDSRPKSKGGQKWFNSHTESDEIITPEDPLHWTGSFFNWNTRCADCHSTDLVKNYDQKTNTFNTTFSEVNVGCEACHGPASEHIKLANANKLTQQNSGFQIDFAPSSAWTFDGGKIAKPVTDYSKASAPQFAMCAECHSRRQELPGSDAPHGAFFEHGALAVARPPLYHADGQILDEDYVLGSFTQSKMSAAGVTCTNCHDPHTSELKLKGNATCEQCHAPADYSTPKHTMHEQGTEAAQCVSCHMPAKVYMGNDSRRDHSFRVPRPDLSDHFKSPNACTSCHTGKSNQWAADAIAVNLKKQGKTESKASMLDALASYTPTAKGQALIQLLGDSSQPSMMRSLAFASTAPKTSGQLRTTVAALADRDPIVRMGAVASLSQIPLQQRTQFMAACLNDPARSIRFQCTRGLYVLLNFKIPEDMRTALTSAVNELVDMLKQDQDNVASASELGVLYSTLKEPNKAEAAFKQALKISPYYNAALLNYSAFLRNNQRYDEALSYSTKATRFTPNDGAAWYSIAASQIGLKQYSKAQTPLEKALRIDSSNIDYSYAYILTLDKLGKDALAKYELSRITRLYPKDKRLQQVATYLKNKNQNK